MAARMRQEHQELLQQRTSCTCSMDRASCTNSTTGSTISWQWVVAVGRSHPGEGASGCDVPRHGLGGAGEEGSGGAGVDEVVVAAVDLQEANPVPRGLGLGGLLRQRQWMQAPYPDLQAHAVALRGKM